MPATELLYGRNAVRETLHAGRRQHRRLLVAARDGAGGAPRDIVALARQARLEIVEAPRPRLDRAVPGANHQGVLLETGAYPYADFHALLSEPVARTPLFLALDQLQDPQNVGTLLRTAEAVGVTGVLIPTHRAATITPAVVNASSGATEHLRIAQVTNLVRALEQLKGAGLWVVGLEGLPEAEPLGKANLDGPLALVVGSEGSGISRLVRATCDLLARLPMRGRIGSLNAAVAGSVALYFIDRQRSAAE